MISQSYTTDTLGAADELGNTVRKAVSPPQILAACGAVEEFLHKHTPDQMRSFFSVTFPTLIGRIFGYNDSSPANGWIDIAMSLNDSELVGRIFSLLSPNSVLMSSISAVDRLSLVKYIFPTERLPQWIKYMLENERNCLVLADLCPLLKNRLKEEDSIKGSIFQVQLNVFEYFMFWFAYYPVCRGTDQGIEATKVVKSKKFRLDKWTSSIPGLSSTKQGTGLKTEVNLYSRVLYAYLRAYVPIHDLNTHQPYRSSLLHYSSGYDNNNTVNEKAEFLVNTLIHYWLVANDFSPVSISESKSFGVVFNYRFIISSDFPPSFGFGDAVIMLVKYLNLNSLITKQIEQMKALSVNPLNMHSIMIQRPLYRFLLRTFVCNNRVMCSTKNISKMFTLWINYMRPWKINLEEFEELDAYIGLKTEEANQTLTCGYTSYWQDYVLANYLYYSSLVMHFFGFAHMYLDESPELVVQMVSKVISILTSSKELMELIKNVDTIYHSKPSKSMLNNSLYRFVPSIREQLEDWEEGVCESEANKDLRLFSDSEDGGQQLLQLFVLRAKSELQAISGNNIAKNLQSLNSLESQIRGLYGGSIKTLISSPQIDHHFQQNSAEELFSPRKFGKSGNKYKGDDSINISNDEIAWLAEKLVKVSVWLNESLGLNESGVGEGEGVGPALSYVDVSGASDIMKLVFSSLVSVVGMFVKLMRKYDIKVNLRIFALKKVVMFVFVMVLFGLLKRVFW